MNILKIAPKGVDIPIQQLQLYLYGELQRLWQIEDSKFTMFGRCYRNQTKDGYIPEFFIGNNDYKDSLFDDSQSALAFFGIGEQITINKANVTADAFLVFQVKLTDIKLYSDQRDDEEIHIDVQRLVFNQKFGFDLTGVVTGIDNVYKEYSGWKKTDGIKFRDQQPWHCFRLNFKLLYNPFKC